MNTLHKSLSKRNLQKFSLGLLAAISLNLVGCASTHSGASATNKLDPYENFNRKIFGFNDTVDTYVAAPVANTYKKITPQFLQTGVFNFFNNLKNVNVVLNDLMQAKFDQSMQDTGRFLMNSTVGVGGLFDVAKKVGLEQHEEDFEQTLAVWGVPQGTYLVLPLLGPVTTRGIPGAVFDTAANPASYVGAPIQLVSLLNTRANAEGALKFIDTAALDRYVFTRESFLQWRKHLATDGKDQDIDQTGYGEEMFEDDANASAKPGTATPSKTVSTLPTAATSGTVTTPAIQTQTIPSTNTVKDQALQSGDGALKN